MPGDGRDQIYLLYIISAIQVAGDLLAEAKSRITRVRRLAIIPQVANSLGAAFVACKC